MNQLDFDLEKATEARNAGMKQVAENNQRFMEVARETARRIARRVGHVTADEVRRECPLEPLHPNAYGAVFRSKDFEWTGSFRKSELVQGHGNLQRVWRLRRH